MVYCHQNTQLHKLLIVWQCTFGLCFKRLVFLVKLFCSIIIVSKHYHFTRMTQPILTSFIWEIYNFVNLGDHKESLNFDDNLKQHTFWLVIIPKNNGLYMEKHITIGLYRNIPRETDLKVLWTISLINDKGEECYPKVLESNYKAKGSHIPIDATSYQLDRDIILDSSSGLLSYGKLTIKCTIKILDNENIVNLARLSIENKTITTTHAKALENYQSLLDNAKFSDVVFVIGKKEFKLHKNILSAQSPVFAAMFDSDLEESKQNRVEITDVDLEVFEAMIRFIYTANVDSVQQYALDLFVVADKYQLNSLKDICAQSLGTNLTTESVAKIFLLANMHSAQELKSTCVKYINSNTKEVFVTEGWKHLVKNCKVELLLELYYDVTKFENK